MEIIFVVSYFVLWILVLASLLLNFVVVRRISDSSTNSGTQGYGGLAVGSKAPDFYAESLKGDPITLANFAGQRVAFLFLGPNCGPCQRALPRYEELGPKAAAAGVKLVVVSVENRESTAGWVQEYDVRLPVLVANREQYSFVQDYKVTGTPSYCLVDEAGYVTSAGHPSFEWGEWKTLAENWTSSKREKVLQSIGKEVTNA